MEYKKETAMSVLENLTGDGLNNNEITEVLKEALLINGVIGYLPNNDQIETASLDYREKSDSENMDEDDLQIITNWWDKQEAFQQGVKWLVNYLKL